MASHLILFNDAVLCTRVIRALPRDPTEAPLPWNSPVVPLLNRPGAGVSHLALDPDWFYMLDQVRRGRSPPTVREATL